MHTQTCLPLRTRQRLLGLAQVPLHVPPQPLDWPHMAPVGQLGVHRQA